MIKRIWTAVLLTLIIALSTVSIIALFSSTPTITNAAPPAQETPTPPTVPLLAEEPVEYSIEGTGFNFFINLPQGYDAQDEIENFFPIPVNIIAPDEATSISYRVNTETERNFVIVAAGFNEIVLTNVFGVEGSATIFDILNNRILIDNNAVLGTPTPRTITLPSRFEETQTTYEAYDVPFTNPISGKSGQLFISIWTAPDDVYYLIFQGSAGDELWGQYADFFNDFVSTFSPKYQVDDVNAASASIQAFYNAVNVGDFASIPNYLCKENVVTLQEGLALLARAGIEIRFENVVCAIDGSRVLCDYTLIITVDDKTNTGDFTEEPFDADGNKACGNFDIPEPLIALAQQRILGQ